MLDVAANVTPVVVAGEEEPHERAGRRVAAEAQHRHDTIAHALVGRGEQRRPGAHAHAHHRHALPGRTRERVDGRDDRLDVVRTKPPGGEARHGGDGHVEAGPREEARRRREERVVLAPGGHAVNEHERAGSERRACVAIGAGAGERAALGRRRQPGEGSGTAAAEELDQERPGEQHGAGSVDDGSDENEGDEEETGDPGYFLLTHFTRRYPLNMFTLITTSGVSPTCLSNGVSGRFDFQPSRVQMGATRSSKRPTVRRSLRKWFRITMTPSGRTTRRISRSTATGSGTAEMV